MSNEDKCKDSKEEENEIEKHAITKGGFYASLTGNTKGFTIFIVIVSIVLLAFLIYIVVKAG